MLVSTAPPPQIRRNVSSPFDGDGDLIFKRDGNLVTQGTVGIESLGAISWGPNSNMRSYMGLLNYKYLSDAGSGVTIYVFDTGITLSHIASTPNSFHIQKYASDVYICMFLLNGVWINMESAAY